jgi:AAA-like domain
MERFFNTAGPNKVSTNYTLDPLHRWDLDRVLSLIRQERYFVLHAPRQTGKTSCMLAMVKYLNEAGDCIALYANIEMAQSAREDVERGMRAVMNSIADRYWEQHKSTLLREYVRENYHIFNPDSALNQMLTFWTEQTTKPIVLFLDEVDALVGDTLISLLRQIRSGYDKRPAAFPSSIILCGVRDVRDYRIHSAATKEIITGGSAFNIKAESLRLGNFSADDIRDLYAQHTTETGQVFESEVLELVWHYTAGQPWLVNALAREATEKIETDRSRPITADIMRRAKEQLVLRRDTHLDQLTDKLREERVKNVILPLLKSEDSMPGEINPNDMQYVVDLGLVAKNTAGVIDIANDIYREVIPRELTWTTQLTITNESTWYLQPDGRIDMHKLLLAFQEFFREHSEHWIERFDYREAGPQLLLQAFLQRIVNGGGTIDREYGLGRKRTDLYIEYNYAGGRQKTVLELKLLRKTLAQTLEEGLQQTADYMDKCDTDEGHLLIFDRSEGKLWEEKIWHRKEIFGSKTIDVWGC